MKIQEIGGKLTVSDFDEFDAARIACKIEKDGILFYARLKEGISDAGIKKSVEFLIDEEKKHLSFFEDTAILVRSPGWRATDLISTIPS